MTAATRRLCNRIGYIQGTRSQRSLQDCEDGLTVGRRLESPAKKMAPVAEVFIGALNVRMSILAMSLLMRPYTLTQTDQNTVKSSCDGAGHTFFMCGKKGNGLRRSLVCEKPVGGFGCLRCGGEDGLLVGFQDRQPVLDVLGVIVARFGNDAEIRA